MADTLQIPATKQEDPSKPIENGKVIADGSTGATRISVPTDEAGKSTEQKPAENTSTVPEKFRKADGTLDSDALLRSYTELESKLGGKPAEKKEATPPPTIAADDLTAVANDIRTNGVLSEATYQALAAKGITRDVADQQAAIIKEGQRQYQTALDTHVGGSEILQAIINWAATGLTEGEKSVANAALASGDLAQAKIVLDGLNSRFKAAVGESPEFVNGVAVRATGGVKPFGSPTEIAKAFSDPRYAKDPAYRAEVQKRMEATELGGVRAHA